MDEKNQNTANSPFEISERLKQSQEKTQSPIAPKTDAENLPPLRQDKKSDEPFSQKLRRGSEQFSAMPQEQKFTEPPATLPAADAPLPTQPIANRPADLQPAKKFITPLKLTIFILLLALMGLITVSATLVATEFTIYQPPEPIKNFLENIFSGNLG